MRRRFLYRAAVLLAAAAVVACSATPAAPGGKKAADGKVTVPLPRSLDPGDKDDPYPSTYRPLPAQATAIIHATVLTATGEQIDDGVVVMADGRIAAVGDVSSAVPTNAHVIDGRGKWVTPGIIDVHSHLGVYPSPGVSPRQDGNECTDPNTAGVVGRAFGLAARSGVSACAGRRRDDVADSAGIRQSVWRALGHAEERAGGDHAAMKFPGAPYGLKMACGENPKRVYGQKGQSPVDYDGQRFRLP